MAVLQGWSLEFFYQNDSDEYVGMGHALASGDLLFTSEEASWFPLFRTPGYPLFLGTLYFFGLNDIGVVAVQMLLDAASCLLVFHLVMGVTGSEKGSLLASFLFAINPLFIVYSLQMLSESLFLFVFLLSNVLFFSNYERQSIVARDMVILGLLFGLMIWIRPISILFPVFYAVLLYKKHKVLSPSALLLILPAVFVLLWIMRNYLLAEEAVFSATVLWNVVCYYAGSVANDPASDISGFSHFIWAYHLHDPPVCTLLPYEQLKAGWNPAIEMILLNLPLFIKHSALGSLGLFEPFSPPHRLADAMPSSPTEIEIFGIETTIYENLIPFYAFSLVYSLILYSSSIYLLVKGGRKKKHVLWLFLVLLLYTAVVNGPLNYARYRFPLEPFFIIFAASALAAWLWKKS